MLQQEAWWNLSPGREPGGVQQLLWAWREHPALSWGGRRASMLPPRNRNKMQSCNRKQKLCFSTFGMKFSELTNSFGCLSGLLEFRKHTRLTPQALCVRNTAVKHFIDLSYWQVDSSVASRLKNGLVFRPCMCTAAASESSVIFIKPLPFHACKGSSGSKASCTEAVTILLQGNPVAPLITCSEKNAQTLQIHSAHSETWPLL